MSPFQVSHRRWDSVLPDCLRNSSFTQRPDIQIHLRRSTATTGDEVEGDVHVTATIDTTFDQVDIQFVGTSRSRLEGLTFLASDGKKETSHIFLRRSQLPRSEDCPPHHILRAGKTYAFPFIFIVPGCHMFGNIKLTAMRCEKPTCGSLQASVTTKLRGSYVFQMTFRRTTHQ